MAFPEAQITNDDVLTYGEVRKKVQLLIDDADSEVLRVQRTGDRRRLAIDKNRPSIGPNGSGDDFGESAFPGAILTHQRMDFSGTQCEVRVTECGDAAVMLVNVFGAQQIQPNRISNSSPSSFRSVLGPRQAALWRQGPSVGLSFGFE